MRATQAQPMLRTSPDLDRLPDTIEVQSRRRRG